MADSVAFLVETNIWVDNYAPVRPESALSQKFIKAAVASGSSLFYPVHEIKDVFYNLGTTLKIACKRETGTLSEADVAAIQDIVWGSVNNMTSLATAVGAGQADVWLACKYRSLSNDLEDNLVMVAAERAGVNFIVTRDEKLLRKSTVPAFSPEDALAYLKLQDMKEDGLEG